MHAASVSRLVTVALPVPLFRTFAYEVPEELIGRVVPGARVLVPLRGGHEIGIVTSLDAKLPDGVKAKRILGAPDAEPALSPALLQLADWISAHYAAPLGLALRAMLPRALGEPGRSEPPERLRARVEIARELLSLTERDEVFKRTPAQRDAYEAVESIPGGALVTHLVEQRGVTRAALAALAKRGLVRTAQHAVMRDPFAGRATLAAAHVPSDAQAAAVEALRQSAPGAVTLLHGVTGSGKTLVYVELLKHVVDTLGRTAIVLVPEIALTPQTVDRFRAAFGDRVAVLHSALSDGERLDAWRALHRGERTIAVGARSAIFAPLRNVGAIVVDEEHEASYKQGETPRYHARDAAMHRAGIEGAACVLGSATPSLETWHAVQQGRVRRIALPERAGAGRLPLVEVIDLTKRRARPDDRVGQVLSEPLQAALETTLDRGEQAILLLNRRGFASFVQCPSCGFVATCPNCSISLTAHTSPERMVCHYCLHHQPPVADCPRCGTAVLGQRGLGTQQVERLVGERFPRARIARMDVDTTSGKWAHVEILDRVASGEVDILLGTQMIAKGLDFPNVTLVGVIDADVGINIPDFRASERCFQLLAQVAGRAGRGAKSGRVLIQTRVPAHHAVRCAVTHDYDAFVHEELSGRDSPPYAPVVQLANLILSGSVENEVQRAADAAADWLRRLFAARDVRGVTVVGPAPCPVERVKQRWRWHVLLKAGDGRTLSRVGRYFVQRFVPPGGQELRVTWDRDPVSLL